ncbi:uncharacterized protein DEA37_0002523 [Paragonimus westermani]|uniref:Uncharacterized protein n=1 Tax=Paragonimus westermani TaxID=34504 RepID=A0A5J4NK32_9TREM|nr:uncharacterized protein DEA37_0002523 [Paragonimus westermani]
MPIAKPGIVLVSVIVWWLGLSVKHLYIVVLDNDHGDDDNDDDKDDDDDNDDDNDDDDEDEEEEEEEDMVARSGPGSVKAIRSIDRPAIHQSVLSNRSL